MSAFTCESMETGDDVGYIAKRCLVMLPMSLFTQHPGCAADILRLHDAQLCMRARQGNWEDGCELYGRGSSTSFRRERRVLQDFVPHEIV